MSRIEGKHNTNFGQILYGTFILFHFFDDIETLIWIIKTKNFNSSKKRVELPQRPVNNLINYAVLP